MMAKIRVLVGVLTAALVVGHALSGTAQSISPESRRPCRGFIEPLVSQVGWCRTSPDDPYCRLLNRVFPQCKRTGREMPRIEWSADGALLPSSPKVSSFFFSLRKYEDGNVSVDIAATAENVDDTYSRYYDDGKKDGLQLVMQRIHVSRTTVSSAACPQLVKLVHELERMKIRTVSKPGVVMDGTNVTMWLVSGTKKVIVETVEIGNPLLKWVERLRATTKRFLPKPQPL